MGEENREDTRPRPSNSASARAASIVVRAFSGGQTAENHALEPFSICDFGSAAAYFADRRPAI